MFRTLLDLKLLKCPTPDGGHLGFVQYGRHRGSPSWLPLEIGRRWLYLPLVQKWCLWNDLNNYLIKPPDYAHPSKKCHSLTADSSVQRDDSLGGCRTHPNGSTDIIIYILNINIAKCSHKHMVQDRITVDVAMINN